MRKTILLLVVAFPLMAWPQQAERDSVKCMSLGERLLKPLKWVGKNWSDYDPRYSVPSFYNWAAHLQNTTTQEWLTMESPEGMDVKMRSQMSNRLGPYFGYNWLFYGVTVDLKYGHWLNARDAFDSTMVAWDRFLDEHPTECIVAMIGSDGGGKWNDELARNYRSVIEKYPHRFVEDFDASTRIDEVRGKILVIRRQEDCPFGKLLKFADNAVFDYDCFRVEDVYKEHKTWKKVKLVEQNIREAYENENPNKWYITFNSIAWSPRRHTPYSYAWGGRAIRKPMNKTLREFVELKDYVDFGIVFLDFYNDHGEQPQVVETIINSNFNHLDDE